MDQNCEPNVQKIAYARASLWIPFYTVGMVARIQGEVPADRVRAALRKLRVLYPPLASRVFLEEDGSAWITSEGVGEFPLEVRPKQTEDDWGQVFLEQERIPFSFDRGPLTKFFLLRGSTSCDLISVAPHVVCDGYSMTHVMCDAVTLLNDPERVVAPPAPPPVVSWSTVPHSPADNLLLRGYIRLFNHTWTGKRKLLEQADYEELHRCYWDRQQNGLLVFKLSRQETARLAARCKQNGVSITDALVAAFLIAQTSSRQDGRAQRWEISVPVNIRNRMIEPPGRVVGVYVSAVDPVIRARRGASFWEVAGESHRRILRALEDRPQVLRTLVLEELDPRIADAFVSAVATDRWSGGFWLISRFIKVRGDVRSLIISNIGRVELPDLGSPYHLETLLPFPPLVPGSRLALNVLTVDGQMHLILKFRKDELDGKAEEIRDAAVGYLTGA